MIQIEKDNGRVKWHQIKAEYVSGISQRALAAKYKISREAISKHCMKEGWTEERFRITQTMVSGIEYTTLMTTGKALSLEQRIMGAINGVMLLYGIPVEL